MKETRAQNEEKRHPILVVSRRTGLSQEVLRVWEKRYGVVASGRTPTGRRVYSDGDIDRLRLLREATLLGRRIGTVASLSNDDLLALVEEDRQAERNAPSPARDVAAVTEGSAYLEECLAAVHAADASRLKDALSRAFASLSSPALIEDLIAPLARTIGDLWAQGRLDPYQEHLATALICQNLGEKLSAAPLAGAPAIVFSTPSGQRHEIGALLAATAALGQGWRAVYLGPELPASDIAKAAKHIGAAAVALSIMYPADSPGVRDYLQELRRLAADDVVIFVGGGAASSYSTTIKSIGARLLADTQAFRLALAEIGTTGAPG